MTTNNPYENLVASGYEFDPDLSPEEVKGLVKLAKEGDQDACHKVIAQCFPFILSVLRTVSKNARASGIDIAQAGVEGVLRAIQTVDIERETTFLTYAGSFIKGNMWDVYRSNRYAVKAPRLKDIETSVYPLDDDSTYWEGSYTEDYEVWDRLELVKAGISKIPDKVTRRILRLFYGIECKPCSTDEIAKRLNKSVSRVENLLTKGRRALMDDPGIVQAWLELED